jgi:hypothetical protein
VAVTQRAVGGSRKTVSGRVTPSKLRRGAVIAVDGVLAIGTGAVAGLFATGGGVASAAAPSPGWTGLQSPVPSGLNAPAANPEEDVVTDACASAVLCAGAGTYMDSSHNTQGLLTDLYRGSWSAVEAPMPADAESNPQPAFYSTACPSEGSCLAVGTYKNNSGGNNEGLIESFNGGVWNATEAPVPADAAPASSSDTWLKSVSCPAPGDCMAVGYYTTDGHNSVGLVDTLSGGQWTAQAAPQVSDADTHDEVELAAVSCPSAGDCVADGAYTTSAGAHGLELLTETAGSWTASVAPLPPDAATGSSEYASVAPFQGSNGQSLSCAGTRCALAGEYGLTGGGVAPLLIGGSGPNWTASAGPLPANAQLGGSEDGAVSSVSCGFDGGCAAVGFYVDTSGQDGPLVDSISPSGAVSGSEAPQPPDAAAGSHEGAILNGVSCLSSTDCTAVGDYSNNTNSGNVVSLIDTLAGSTWSAQAGPAPANAATGASASHDLLSVACSGRGACLAGGNFADTSGNYFGLLDTYTPPQGYWLDAGDGGVFAFPNAMFRGSMGGMHLNAPIVGMATTPGDGGYWLVAADGGVFTFGNAKFYGSAGNLHLNKPIVGMAATPDGRGYWLVASDGGIFNYGDAGFYGSAGNIHLNKPIVGMVPRARGRG